MQAEPLYRKSLPIQFNMKKLLPYVFFLSCAFATNAQTSFQEAEKLATFCKVWGFLKYHHPAVASGQLDWDKEFTSRINAVSTLHSKNALNIYYSDWINSLGTIKACKKSKTEESDQLKMNLDLNWMRDTVAFTNSVIAQLEFIKTNRNRSKNFYVQSDPFIGNTKYKNENPYIDSVYPSKELRLLGLSRYWNIINYFFPYKYLIGEDWNASLVEMIPKFKDAKDTIAYHMAMLELTAKINDSHARFSSKYTEQYFGDKWIPFKFKIIDHKAIVTGFNNDSLCKINDIQIGDVFLTVEGKSIENIYQTNSKYIGASNEPTKLRNSYNVIFNGQSDSVEVSFERNGLNSIKYLYRYKFKQIKFQWEDHSNRDTCKIIEGNIGYLNLGLLWPSKTQASLEKLKDTKAIIIDVRNYPLGTMYQLARFLNTDKKAFAKFTIPDLNYPSIYKYSGNYLCGKKNKKSYQGKVILLFNETTQSHAEFTLMALQTAPRVIGIGSQTAGADGNVSLITFPGNYKTYMSAIGVYYPDGKETQRIGIVPDIEVKPTIEGIKARRDEVLERAIEEANRLH